MKRIFAILATCGFALSAHASCYSVYNSAGRLIHQSSEAPVDTLQQYHMTVPQRFGRGSTLVYVRDDESCAALDALFQASRSESDQGGETDGQRRTRPMKADRG